jgi:HK97 family phage major capsid protein
MTIAELHEAKIRLVNQMREIHDRAKKESREFLTTENDAYTKASADLKAINAKIEREKELAEQERDIKAGFETPKNAYRPTVTDAADPATTRMGRRLQAINGNPRYKEALNTYLRSGKSELTSDVVNVLTVGTDAGAGYLVPDTLGNFIIETITADEPITGLANVITTSSDTAFPVEQSIGNFDYVGEGQEFPESDPSHGQVVLSAFKNGGIVRVAEELLQDSAFNLEAYLGRVAGRRFTELDATNYGNGNGAGRPLGIFATTSVAGINIAAHVGAISASAAITGDDVIRTKHRLGRQYRARATWVASDGLVLLLSLLKGEDNQYLWQPGLTADRPDMLCGRPLVISDGAPAPAPDARSLALVDLSNFHIGMRLGSTVRRLNERYAERGQVGFRFVRRHDARLGLAPACAFFQHGPAA